MGTVSVHGRVRMYAAAISAFPPRPWTSEVSLLDRDFSNHARLYGSTGVMTLYPQSSMARAPPTWSEFGKSAVPKRKNQQKSIDWFWDRWVEEQHKLKPPGTEIHKGQMVRKQSLDIRFGGVLRPPSRFKTSFGNTPQEQFMGHSYHQPEVTSRVMGPASLRPDPPRSLSYW